MNKTLIGLFIISIMCFSLVYAGTAQANVKNKTWIVNKNGTGDFTAIQPALDAAKAGDTIYVQAGVYYEHLTIAKTLILLGANKDTTIIDAGGVNPGKCGCY